MVRFLIRTPILAAAVMFLSGSALAQQCQNTSVGFPPINDLGQSFFRGLQGGLYPGGENEVPDPHRADGLEIAEGIFPLDRDGNPDPVAGKIVFLSIGMSNSWQEFAAFRAMADTLQVRNPSVAVINGAQPGSDINAILDPAGEYWRNVHDSLGAAGFSTEQVQIVWFKQADAFPGLSGEDTTFAVYTEGLREKFESAINILKEEFPRTQLCYLASRAYGGYAATQLNPEPFAYYTGWAVKLLLEDQINGSEGLRFRGPDPKAPWLSWGTYLWADGLVPRTDGLFWECEDFQGDGTHPSESGERKVASQLISFLTSDETAVPWFVNGLSTSVPAGETVPSSFSLVNYPNPFNPTTTIRFDLPVAGRVRLAVYDMTGREVVQVINGYLSAGEHESTFDGAGLSSGVYTYRLSTEERVMTGRMVLIR